MKLLVKIILLCIFFTPLVVACEGDEDFDPVRQQNAFRDFLDKLEVEYDSILPQYIYKLALPETLYDLGIPVGEEVKSGDRISIYYAGYLFNSGATTPETQYGRGSMFTTNIESYSVAAGWDENPYTEPMDITLGSSRLNGLNLGIPGYRVGEGFLLYLSADHGYGSDEIGFVEPGSAIVYEIYIMGKVTD